jgi:SAM-dependent methyltransferase
MTSQAQIPDQQNTLVEAIVANVVQPNNHELLRHLGQVLGISPTTHVLLIVDGDLQGPEALKQVLDCKLEVYQGDLQKLPFTDHSFDSAIVVTPISRHVHTVAKELSRVLRPNGCLGMVVFSVYRDQVPEDAALYQQVMPLLATSKPAAAYRAVLAETGFTAFVSEDRRHNVLRTARDSYREHMLRENSDDEQRNPSSQALGLIATGGVSLTLITAEKSA